MKTKQTTVKKPVGNNTMSAKAYDAILKAAELDQAEEDAISSDERMAGSEDSLPQATNPTYGRPYVSIDKLNELFAKKYKMGSGEDSESDDSSNVDTMVEIFCKAVEHIATTNRTFGFSDVSAALRMYQFEPLRLRAMFDHWVAFANEWHKLTTYAGVYDDPVYSWQ